MSLHVAAQHLANKGRNGDTELVHMTKDEIKSLQGLALAAGGSLSINPDTGLVEAGFLKNMLPMIAGAGLMMIPGMQTVGAGWIGAGVGALEAARTGDIGKGLMAGLGAYGGAGLAGGLMGTAAGAVTPGTSGITAGATPAATTSAAPSTLGSTAGMEGASQALSSGTNMVPQTSATLGSITPPPAGSTFGSIAAPTGAPTVAPSMTGSQIAKYGMAAAAPVISGMATPPAPPGLPEEDPRYKGSPYRYNLAKDFQGYVPNTPNPYYRPTGLGYAEGGDVMLAAGGSYEDEPMGDTPGMASGGDTKKVARAKYTSQAQLNAMDPWEAAQAELDNSIYFSKGPGAVQRTPSAMSSLGDVQIGRASGGSIGGYSDGGRMLKGPGDGMSDSIPATIGRKQPARLADGEFVVPADVVSHLGNGSTDAGAKRLYSMMDKVRTARTGNKKQGKQINPNKFLPRG